MALAAAPANAGDIVIDEIYYAPKDKTSLEEFVELYNNGTSAVDLAGWYFSEGISYRFAASTVMQPGEYLVVAEDPATLLSLYPGIRAVGPFLGKLSNDGEEIVLRDPQGEPEDSVDYRRGFPWPTVSKAQGYSIELIDPDLDNELGGSWRASNPSVAPDAKTLLAAGASWAYRKGTAEASSPPAAWRERGFDDDSWPRGNAPIGYGEAFIVTELADMRNSYSSYFLRTTFEVAQPEDVAGLRLEALYDDGFNAWINGVHVLNANVPADEMAFDGLAATTREDAEYEEHALPPPAGYLVAGTNVLCVQVHNISASTSSDAFFDCRLVTSTGSAAGAGPTPGKPNTVRAENAPPQLRQVESTPQEPVSGDLVIVTVRATDPDGVASVSLEYQVVEPGAYVELGDPVYGTSWTAVPMNDSGQNGDVVSGDGIYSGAVPPSVQNHRRLIRYRITAADTGDRSVRVPYPDDPQPNFAYFVYDGPPPWLGAIEPGSTNATRSRVVEYSPEVLSSVPAYHLIAKRKSVEDATWNSKYGGDSYPWKGTLVVGGKVYDHIGYRARGGVWRYSMGKNMWKFDFLTGHRLRVRDNFGRELKTGWSKLNLSACIQQGDYLHRGEQGMFEAAGFKLFDLAGLETYHSFWITLRIVDEEDEVGLRQYDGDLWGLYLAIEQPDGQFLEEHDIPDGNLYKMEGGTGELNNLGPLGPKDKSDLNEFLDTYVNSNPSDAWWRDHLDLARYYNYRSIVEAIHHGDVGYGKNYFYYLNPDSGQWRTYAWDIDLTWADNMFGDGNEPFKSRVLTRAAFGLEYKNRIREIRDLLYNTGEAYKLIDELAGVIDDPSGAPSLVDFDRARWDYHPVMINASIVNLSKAGQGRFYQIAPTKDFPGMVKLMKDYVVSRGQYIDQSLSADSAIPATPTILSTGPAGYPIDALHFQSSDFSDPQGSGTFGAMRWRVAEVTAPGAPKFDPTSPKLFEIEPAWESAELASFDPTMTVPSSALKIGRTYRARVRMKDTTGRWSHWSAPVEFVAGEPTAPFPQQTSLRVTEIHYHPAADLDQEFVEVANIGTQPIDLTPVAFTAGIEFRFADGAIPSLAPGERAVVVHNLIAFRARYGASIPVAGEFKDRLSNAGELLELTYGGSVTIQEITFEDEWYPLSDGGGRSLEAVDVAADPATWSRPEAWAESAVDGGTPGAARGGPPPGGRRVPGDSNGSGQLELGDAVSLLWRLFVGGVDWPCDGASAGEGGNLLLLDVNGSGSVNLTDAVAILNYLFLSGAPPSLGTSCVRFAGCTDFCPQ